MKKETEIQAEILQFLKSLGVFCWRSNNISVKGRRFIGLKGVPDIICLVGKPGHNFGKYCGIEVKSSTGKLSVEQLEFKKNVEINGGFYFVINSINQIEELLQLLR